LRRAQTIDKRLGGTANMMELFPPKPKGMRWRTFERLAAKHDDDLVGRSMQMMLKIGLFG